MNAIKAGTTRFCLGWICGSVFVIAIELRKLNRKLDKFLDKEKKDNE